MSDIQRYEAYISGVCDLGCGESMHDEGDYVKYYDHIAEVEKLQQQLAEAQARIDELESVIDLRWLENIEKEKSRIKAEGIREMLESGGLVNIWAWEHQKMPMYADEDIQKYANKLEQGDV